ncbi:MAG: glycosyltransferase [Acidobacteria bacterium]|nr:glycosyltransferase [Acidobacteriota bacterium]
MSSKPRIAFFTDSYHDLNGVSRTSRQFVKFAGKHSIPFLSVRAGEKTARFSDGSVSILELKRSRLSIALDDDLKFDPVLQRYWRLVKTAVETFRTDLIHVTSPGDIGILGTRIARNLHIPLVAAWQTNIHEFAARRLDKTLGFIPASWRKPGVRLAEERILDLVLFFYKMARIILVPNRELMDMVGERTGKHCFLMRRGIDTEQFSPSFRNRKNQVFRIGYVGRLRPEKDVRMLWELERALLAEGAGYFQFLIVGDGSERRWLERNMSHADFTGALTGEPLSRAYADMDVFVFPSRTDTFGNVVLEAMASGLPAVVTDCGGPKSIVSDGETGFIVSDVRGFCSAVLSLMKNPNLRNQMSLNARSHACAASWEGIFNNVLKAYDTLWDAPADIPYRRALGSSSNGNAARIPPDMPEESKKLWPDTYQSY